MSPSLSQAGRRPGLGPTRRLVSTHPDREHVRPRFSQGRAAGRVEARRRCARVLDERSGVYRPRRRGGETAHRPRQERRAGRARRARRLFGRESPGRVAGVRRRFSGPVGERAREAGAGAPRGSGRADAAHAWTCRFEELRSNAAVRCWVDAAGMFDEAFVNIGSGEEKTIELRPRAAGAAKLETSRKVIGPVVIEVADDTGGWHYIANKSLARLEAATLRSLGPRASSAGASGSGRSMPRRERFRRRPPRARRRSRPERRRRYWSIYPSDLGADRPE